MSFSASRTDSRTDHAARVARKVLGDLQSLHRLYSCSTDQEIQNYAHDIELGIKHSCISSFKFYLKSKADSNVLEAYEYAVKENGEIEEASKSSGRHVFNTGLINSSLDVHVSLSDRPKWDELKSGGHTNISWSPTAPIPLTGFVSSTDGAYMSGQLGVARTVYRSNVG